MKRALITGILGQDGILLARFLADRSYEIVGLARRKHASRVYMVPPDTMIRVSDVEDADRFARILGEQRIDEIYNLAAESFGPASWAIPVDVGQSMGLDVTRILEAVRTVSPHTRVFQASSSEMFGNFGGSSQNEETPVRPLTPYAAAKAYGHWMIGAYRQRYGLFACSGILFNHESFLRRPEFVTRKITSTVARISLGLASELRLGNLDVRRDWGYAGDFVRAMWKMLQVDKAHDFVIATGEHHSIRQFCDLAFKEVGLNYRDWVVCDESLVRPVDPEPLGDISLARKKLDWKPTISLEELVSMMVQHDVEQIRGREAPQAGESVQNLKKRDK